MARDQMSGYRHLYNPVNLYGWLNKIEIVSWIITARNIVELQGIELQGIA